MSIIYSEQLQRHLDTDLEDELELVKEQAEPNEYVFEHEGKIYKF